MAQGLEFTDEQKEQIIQSITPYLELGFSRNKACEMLGITPSTLSTWVTKDESLRMRLVASENMVNALAIKNVVDAVKREGELEDDIKKENSWKWLERRMKDEFSTRSELTGKDGENLIPKPILGGLSRENVEHVPTNNSNQEDSEVKKED